jgi:CRISPR-associated endonuclease/helicase Cas3
VVITPVIECWRRTGPVPNPDETVVPYLHGVDRGSPGVTVVWRAGLPTTISDSGEVSSFELWPPVQGHETVEVSVPAARAWLADAVEAVPSDRADLESVAEDDLERRVSKASTAGAFIRRGDEWTHITSVGQIRPNDVIVVPCTFGGHDRWSFAPHSKDPVADVADLVDHGQEAAWFRLDDGALRSVVGELTDHEVVSLGAARNGEVPHADRVRSVTSLLNSLADRGAGGLFADRLAVSARSLSTKSASFGFVGGAVADGSVAWPVAVTVRGRRARFGSDDGAARSSATGDVTLDAHLRSVGERASQFASLMGLDTELADAVTLAGRFHDLGKADPRFQALLRGGPLWLAESYGSDAFDLLAKSTVASGSMSELNASSWPAGYRHEAVSLALVEAADDSLFDGVDRGLVEHLVASHHGHARPLFPARTDGAPGEVSVTFDSVDWSASSEESHPAWSQPRRFSDLCERYGEWGLALLEATVRLADISISEEGR